VWWDEWEETEAERERKRRRTDDAPSQVRTAQHLQRMTAPGQPIVATALSVVTVSCGCCASPGWPRHHELDAILSLPQISESGCNTVLRLQADQDADRDYLQDMSTQVRHNSSTMSRSLHFRVYCTLLSCKFASLGTGKCLLVHYGLALPVSDQSSYGAYRHILCWLKGNAWPYLCAGIASRSPPAAVGGAQPIGRHSRGCDDGSCQAAAFERGPDDAG